METASFSETLAPTHYGAKTKDNINISNILVYFGSAKFKP
jgi:hypothetical protein